MCDGTVQAKQDAGELQEKSKALKKEIQESEAAAVEAENERDACLKLIGNLVHDSVPVSDSEVRDIQDSQSWDRAVGSGGESIGEDIW